MEKDRKHADSHTLLVGDLHADEVKDNRDGSRIRLEDLKGIDGIISDIGESKSTIDGQMDYSRKKRHRFEELLYALGVNSKKEFFVAYKELCPWDKQFIDFCRRHGLNIIPYPGASLASTEVYAIRNGRKTALGKEPLKEIRRIGRELLAVSETITEPTTTIMRPKVEELLEHTYVYVDPPEDRVDKL